MANILVVDDDADLRGVLRLTLQRAGHFVQEAADGEEALRVLGLLAVDVVLLDLFEGPETLREVRERYPGVPVVAISAGRVEVLPVAAKLGAAQVLDKPFTRQALLTAVGRALERRAG
jgi:DNA-binding NtrC family response regulator